MIDMSNEESNFERGFGWMLGALFAIGLIIIMIIVIFSVPWIISSFISIYSRLRILTAIQGSPLSMIDLIMLALFLLFLSWILNLSRYRGD